MDDGLVENGAVAFEVHRQVVVDDSVILRRPESVRGEDKAVVANSGDPSIAILVGSGQGAKAMCQESDAAVLVTAIATNPGRHRVEQKPRNRDRALFNPLHHFERWFQPEHQNSSEKSIDEVIERISLARREVEVETGREDVLEPPAQYSLLMDGDRLSLVSRKRQFRHDDFHKASGGGRNRFAGILDLRVRLVKRGSGRYTMPTLIGP